MGSQSSVGFRIDPDRDLDLAREFMANPIGLHSPNLQRLLRAMRAGPVKGKYALLTTKPGREWTLIRLSGARDVAPTILRHHVYHDLDEAERHVFRLRTRRAVRCVSSSRRRGATPASTAAPSGVSTRARGSVSRAK